MADYWLSATAHHQLWDIWRFIAKNNPDAATEVIEAAYRTFQFLAENPRVGTKRDFPRLGPEIRSWPITGYGSYVVIYTSSKEGVIILRVYHAARDIEALFRRK